MQESAAAPGVGIIPNKSSPPAILLREAWREGTGIRRRTVANLSKMPPELVDAARAAPEGGIALPKLDDAAAVRRSLPHGRVAAVPGTFKPPAMARILGRKASRMRSLAVAAVAARPVDPGSRPACARTLSSGDRVLQPRLGSRSRPGGRQRGAGMLDWLRGRQPWIERSLAGRHLKGDSAPVLYDAGSSCLEGRCCPLAAFGHSRDGKKGKKQTAYGLLCAASGCPAAAEVFPGNAGDPSTLAARTAKARSRFGISRVALVGDRGMTASARIREDLRPADLDWISAPETADIRKLPLPGDAPLAPERLVPDAAAEIASPDFPGERLTVCPDPRLREERARRRDELLQASEKILREIAGAAARGKPGPASRDRFPEALGCRASRRKAEMHFDIEVREDGASWSRSRGRIAAEARLDGACVVRASLDASSIGTAEAVEACKSLARVERTFRSMKAPRLEIRPARVYSEERVRARAFLCMLAARVEWRMRHRLAPILFEDDDPEGARARRASPVAPAEVSDGAGARANSKKTADGLPVHSMPTLLADLAAPTPDEAVLPTIPDRPPAMAARPTKLQKHAFDLLGIDPANTVAMQSAG